MTLRLLRGLCVFAFPTRGRAGTLIQKAIDAASGLPNCRVSIGGLGGSSAARERHHEDAQRDQNNGSDDLARDAFEGVIRQQMNRVFGRCRTGDLLDDCTPDGVEGADDGAARNQA